MKSISAFYFNISYNLVSNEASGEQSEAKKINKRQSKGKTVLFKPNVSSNEQTKELNDSSMLNISEVQFTEDNSIKKPKGRGRKPKVDKIEIEKAPSQTPSQVKKIKKNEKGKKKMLN